MRRMTFMRAAYTGRWGGVTMRERIEAQRFVTERVGDDCACSVLHEVRQSLDSRQPSEHVRTMSPTERDRF